MVTNKNNEVKMKNVNKSLFSIILIISLSFFFACTDEKEDITNTQSGMVMQKVKNFNVTILLDLSDRISANKNPGQLDRDINCIMTILDALKNNMIKKGTIDSEDRIRVVFYPNHSSTVTKDIAASLNIDFGEMTPSQRKQKFEMIDTIYMQNLSVLYSIASTASIFNGSDIFNYFKHRVIDDCILNDSSFVNLLVIMTDGYMYHNNSCYSSGNRFSFITPNAKHVDMFRKNFNWQDMFDKDDYGFINLGIELSNLKVLALEFSPWGKNASDYDIMHKYWSKWFEELGINKNNYKIVKTDLPSLNKNIISQFMQKLQNEK